MRIIFLFLTLFFFCQCKSDKVDLNLGSDEAIAEVSNKPKVKHIDIVGAKNMIASNPKLIIIDARTPKEYAEGTLPNALNIDVKADDFVQKIGSLDKSATYLMHCRSGKRSMKASEIMLEHGFVDVTNMDGGYLAWVKAVD